MGGAGRAAGVTIAGYHNHHYAVLSQGAAFPQHGALTVPGAQSVDEYGAGRHRVHHLPAALGQFQHIPILQHKDALGGQTHIPSQPGVGHQMPIFAMHRHKVARLGQAEHHFQLLLAGVAVNMDGGNAVVQHLGPLSQQVVNGAADQQFVARNGGGGNDDRIPLHDRHIPMILIGNPHQGGSGFPLAAGGQQHYLLRGIGADFAQGKEGIRRQGQVAHSGGHTHIVGHTAADDADLAVMPGGRIHHLLHPGNQGGKGRHHHPPRGIANSPLKGIAQDMLRGGVAGNFGIGGVGTEEQHAIGTVLGQGSQVNGTPVHRSMVDLEIPGMNDGA